MFSEGGVFTVDWNYIIDQFLLRSVTYSTANLLLKIIPMGLFCHDSWPGDRDHLVVDYIKRNRYWYNMILLLSEIGIRNNPD